MFSDLDGSLLDHDTYDWRPAQPSLDALKRRGIPLVLVSSKTLAELDYYQNELELAHPAVAENGAAIHIPPGYFRESNPLQAVPVSRETIQSAYRQIKTELDCQCEAFFELGLAGIMRETGLTKEQAGLADQRLGSEPVLWLDTEDNRHRFEQAARRNGLRCVRGGRFLHIMGDTDKAAAVRRLVDAYRNEWPDTTITSISLGDGPNDLGMLACTDVGVIIARKHDHPMALESGNRILKTESPGPAGWNEAMQTLLSEYQ